MQTIVQFFTVPENAALVNVTETPAPLRLNFRNAPLQSVLNYLHQAANLTIRAASNVEIERPIDLWREEPVTKEEALSLFQQALIQKGYAAIRKGCLLDIRRSQDAKKDCIPLPVLACCA